MFTVPVFLHHQTGRSRHGCRHKHAQSTTLLSRTPLRTRAPRTAHTRVGNKSRPCRTHPPGTGARAPCAYPVGTPPAAGVNTPRGNPKTPPFTYLAPAPHSRCLRAQHGAANASEPARPRPRTPQTRALMERHLFWTLRTTRGSQTSPSTFAKLENAPCARLYQERDVETPGTRRGRAIAMAGPRPDTERPRTL